MFNQTKQLFIILFMLLSFSSYSQKSRIIGLWEAVNVSAGEHNMTPVAKWFRINADGTFESGNGWLQNGSGSWEYDLENNLFSSFDSLALKDEFGGFTVSFDAEHMYWEREEEGMQVKVSLKPIKQLPASPSDMLLGIWELSSEEEKLQYLHLRWDRIYKQLIPNDEKRSGYWMMHGHKPQLTFLPHREGLAAESWQIEVSRQDMTLTGISDSNKGKVLSYIRRYTYPQ